MPTLFFDPKFAAYSFQNTYQLGISIQFMTCMDSQLTTLFELKTALRISKQISISWRDESQFIIEFGEISKFPLNIYVNHNWNPVTVLWKSKSGRIYRLEDTDIDCDDIEFWFEELDVALIHRQMFPNVKLPFKLKELSYELVVTRINMDCILELLLKDDEVTEAEHIDTQVDAFIAAFNKKSEKKDRKDGVIHHWSSKIENDKLIYDIDLGSTGPLFFKKLLPYLSDLNCFTRVELR